MDTESTTKRFPEAYIGEYDGKLEYITYKWQTRRYPVSTEVQDDVDGQFAVQAGRSDVITNPAMYASDQDARKHRADYAREAVDGRNLKSGETMEIPIPRSDTGIDALLDTLGSDKVSVAEIDLDELEETINNTVYKMFDIMPQEQDVIEEYLETFRIY